MTLINSRDLDPLGRIKLPVDPGDAAFEKPLLKVSLKDGVIESRLDLLYGGMPKQEAQMPKPFDRELGDKIRSLRAEGKSYKEIMEATGATHNQINSQLRPLYLEKGKTKKEPAWEQIDACIAELREMADRGSAYIHHIQTLFPDNKEAADRLIKDGIKVFIQMIKEKAKTIS